MTENEKRMQRVCFTGHRPEKLKRGKRSIIQDLEEEIRKAVADGLNVFIVKLICACPYEGFERKWNQEWQKAYREILAAADFVKYICNGYSPACFQIRKEWMVNHSARVIAVFNDEKSGTKNTMDYAAKVDVPFVRIEG